MSTIFEALHALSSVGWATWLTLAIAAGLIVAGVVNLAIKSTPLRALLIVVALWSGYLCASVSMDLNMSGLSVSVCIMGATFLMTFVLSMFISWITKGGNNAVE